MVTASELNRKALQSLVRTVLKTEHVALVKLNSRSYAIGRWLGNSGTLEVITDKMSGASARHIIDQRLAFVDREGYAYEFET